MKAGDFAVRDITLPEEVAADRSRRRQAALREVNPAIAVVDAPDSDHFTVLADPVTLAAVSAVLGD